MRVCVRVRACGWQLFPQIEEAMVQPLRDSRDRYEELKQIDDAMNEVGVSLRARKPLIGRLTVTDDVMFPPGAEEEK